MTGHFFVKKWMETSGFGRVTKMSCAWPMSLLFHLNLLTLDPATLADSEQESRVQKSPFALALFCRRQLHPPWCKTRQVFLMSLEWCQCCIPAKQRHWTCKHREDIPITSAGSTDDSITAGQISTKFSSFLTTCPNSALMQRGMRSFWLISISDGLQDWCKLLHKLKDWKSDL